MAEKIQVHAFKGGYHSTRFVLDAPLAGSGKVAYSVRRAWDSVVTLSNSRRNLIGILQAISSALIHVRGHRVVGAVNRFWGNVGRLVFHILRPDGAHWGNFRGLPFWDMLGPILIQGGVKVTRDEVQFDLTGLLLRSFAIDGGIGYPQA